MKDLVYKIKKYLTIFMQFQKINVMNRMAYPASFFVSLIAVLFMMLLSVLFVKVNFSYVSSISGWNSYQIFGVVGSYMIVEGLMWFLFSQLNAINLHIGEGSLDGILLKPIDSQFIVSFWRGDLEDFLRIVMGTFLIFVSIKNTIGVHFLNMFLFLMLIFNGLVMFYSFVVIVRSFSFWLIDGSGFWLLTERISANSQYPIDIYYNKMVRGIFTFVVPLAFVATVPAKVLTFLQIDWKFVGLSFLMMVVFFSISRWFWKFSLKRYSSASS